MKGPSHPAGVVVSHAEDPGVAIGVGSDGIEWRISLARFANGPAFQVIRAEIIDCGTQGEPCQTLDEIDYCGFFEGF